MAIVNGSGLAFAQESGWQYSPLPGEGDRAALGCAYGANPIDFLCLAVRCEDDKSVGLYLYIDRPQDFSGTWTLDVDKESFDVTGLGPADSAPYASRVAGDATKYIDRLVNGEVAYLDVGAGEDERHGAISLQGSFAAIHQALYFCAPKVPADGEPNATPSVTAQPSVPGDSNG